MRKPYSRLASTEEKKNIRRAVGFSVLTVGAILLVFVFGLPTVAKFAAFLTDLRKGTTPVEQTDTTPPPPPRISTLPDATKEYSLEIDGTSEAGSTVILSFNGDSREVVASNDGGFTFSVTLKKGENKISLTAKDAAGNESQATPVYTVLFDNEPPKLDISSPRDGEQFYGSKQRQVTISGTTEPGTTLTINDRIIKVDDAGSFTYATTLDEGDNTFNVKAVDKAGNETGEGLTVHFSL